MNIQKLTLVSNNIQSIPIPPNCAWLQPMQLKGRYDGVSQHFPSTCPVFELSLSDGDDWFLVSTLDRIPLLSGFSLPLQNAGRADEYLGPSRSVHRIRVRWHSMPTTPSDAAAPVVFALSERIDALDLPPPRPPQPWLWERTNLNHACPVNRPANMSDKNCVIIPAQLARFVQCNSDPYPDNATGAVYSLTEQHTRHGTTRVGRRAIPLWFSPTRGADVPFDSQDAVLSGTQERLRFRAWRSADGVAATVTTFSCLLSYDVSQKSCLAGGRSTIGATTATGCLLTCLVMNRDNPLRQGSYYVRNSTPAIVADINGYIYNNMGADDNADMHVYQGNLFAAAALAAGAGAGGNFAITGWDCAIVTVKPNAGVGPVFGECRLSTGNY